jgi:hypothetical protein
MNTSKHMLCAVNLDGIKSTIREESALRRSGVPNSIWWLYNQVKRQNGLTSLRTRGAAVLVPPIILFSIIIKKLIIYTGLLLWLRQGDYDGLDMQLGRRDKKCIQNSCTEFTCETPTWKNQRDYFYMILEKYVEITAGEWNWLTIALLLAVQNFRVLVLQLRNMLTIKLAK